jgi:hypothetical protein
LFIEKAASRKDGIVKMGGEIYPAHGGDYSH